MLLVQENLALTEEQVDKMLEAADYKDKSGEDFRQMMADEQVDAVVVVQPLRHIGLVPKKGSYVVKEEIQKPPRHDHPCNITITAIKIAFPEMKSEVFINLLGYKEPNLVHLARCKGECYGSGSPIACSPTKLRDKTVDMRVKSFLTGKEPRERLRELVLEEHVECGCQCTPQAAAACAGKFNDVSCECECPLALFGQEKIRCESQAGAYWDIHTCQCRGNSIKARGVDLERHTGGGCAGGEFREVVPLEAPGLVDVTTWLLLGSSLTMVLLLATTTLHYRRRSRTLKEESLSRPLTVSPSEHLINSEEALPVLLRENTVGEPRPQLRGHVVVERARCFDNQSAGASLGSMEASCQPGMVIGMGHQHQQHQHQQQQAGRAEARNGDKHGFSNMYCGGPELFLNPGEDRLEDSY